MNNSFHIHFHLTNTIKYLLISTNGVLCKTQEQLFTTIDVFSDKKCQLKGCFTLPTQFLINCLIIGLETS